jgi:hypothetical protein
LKPGSVAYMMTGNAISNLALAIGELANRPNRAAVQVYTAIELVLKARLAEEHWSLVVNKDPDLTKFEDGDFVSVTFEEACRRLNQAVRDPLPLAAKDAFDKLRKRRNKIVHFHTNDMIYGQPITGDSDTRELVKVAWNHLHGVMLHHWALHFDLFRDEIARTEASVTERQSN